MKDELGRSLLIKTLLGLLPEHGIELALVLDGYYSTDELKDQVYVGVVLEVIVQLQDVRVVERIHNVHLVLHLLDHVCFLQQLLFNDLDCVSDVGLLVDDLLDDSKST